MRRTVNIIMRLNDVLQSGTSFSGRRRSRSPSPVGIGVRSRSMDGRMPKITVDRTPSDESLASSCAQMSMTSPGSSSSPRSPISPPWSSASNAAIAARPSKAEYHAKCMKQQGCSFFQRHFHLQTMRVVAMLPEP